MNEPQGRRLRHPLDGYTPFLRVVLMQSGPMKVKEGTFDEVQTQ
jgi:hypothetical protein